jgi:hypothetical protein
MTDYMSYAVDTAAAATDYVPIEKVSGNQVFKTRQTPGSLVVSDGATDRALSNIAAAVLASTSTLSGATGAPVQTAERTFTETAGAGVYTGSVNLPAGATLIDIIVNGIAVWDNTGTAAMTVGDAGAADGYFTAVNLKATDLLAGESLSFGNPGSTEVGSYIANGQVSPRYSATSRVISGVITTSSTGGSTGRTRMTVIWSAPAAAFITAATKV